MGQGMCEEGAQLERAKLETQRAIARRHRAAEARESVAAERDRAEIEKLNAEHDEIRQRLAQRRWYHNDVARLIVQTSIAVLIVVGGLLVTIMEGIYPLLQEVRDANEEVSTAQRVATQKIENANKDESEIRSRADRLQREVIGLEREKLGLEQQKLARELDARDIELASLRTELKAVQAAKAELGGLQEVLTGLQAANAELSDGQKRLREERDHLIRELGTKVAASEERASQEVSAERDRALREISSLKEQISRLKRDNENLASAQDETEVSKRNLKEQSILSELYRGPWFLRAKSRAIIDQTKKVGRRLIFDKIPFVFSKNQKLTALSGEGEFDLGEWKLDLETSLVFLSIDFDIKYGKRVEPIFAFRKGFKTGRLSEGVALTETDELFLRRQR